MGKIYFVKGLAEEAMKILHEAQDGAEIAYDLSRITEVLNSGTNDQARQLDDELRKKYPTINIMLNIANSLPPIRLPINCRPVDGYSASDPDKENLRRAYWGIICDVALKKGIKSSIEACIDRIEEYAV